jgi:hypothetical protein
MVKLSVTDTGVAVIYSTGVGDFERVFALAGIVSLAESCGVLS